MSPPLNMTCRGCLFWDRAGDGTSHGYCHRFPPQPMLTPVGMRAFFPTTLANDWCGEHATVEGEQPAANVMPIRQAVADG